MPVKSILQLGNPLLYEVCKPVQPETLSDMHAVVSDLHDTMMANRERFGVGRAIAAPQIGMLKRLIYMHIDRPVVLINPILHTRSEEMVELWDDCMSFPGLLVRVKRHARCQITYRDMKWQQQEMALQGDLSELLQHEYDHLDGILAVSRAVDGQAFAFSDHLPLEEREAYRMRISRGMRS